MSRIFITGSADGLGQMASKLLTDEGHSVVLHARNAERAMHALSNVPAAEKVLIADLSNLAETKKLAAEVNEMGRFNAIIHNAGVYRESDSLTFAVNSLAPYILTCLIQKPERLIYLGSGMHLNGNPYFKNMSKDTGQFNYSDSKLQVLLLSMAAAHKWPDVYVNTVNPGWVPTKMGGTGAPDDLLKGVETQVWLAVSNDDKAKVSGNYFFHKKEEYYLQAADDPKVQDRFLKLCEQISGVNFPFE
ncbi:MAG TPA: SDR family NAD(P)-dependent oxidoreductase [Ignavibacteria bacterium]|nr:SDR family NAD(P)-dependent oxidoreductase [Ignavibacteria bacterium]